MQLNKYVQPPPSFTWCDKSSANEGNCISPGQIVVKWDFIAIWCEHPMFACVDYPKCAEWYLHLHLGHIFQHLFPIGWWQQVSPPAFLLIGTCGFESNHPKGLPSPFDSNINGVQPRLPGKKETPQFLSPQTFWKSNKGHLRVVHILSRVSSVHKWFPIAWLERFAVCIAWSNQQEKRGLLGFASLMLGKRKHYSLDAWNN